MDLPQAPNSCKVYTPAPLADALASALFEKNSTERWLEPSCGHGAFLAALQKLGVSKDRILGIDLDRKPSNLDAFARVRRGIDFLAWSKETRVRVDCVVGNPPFAAIRSLPKVLRLEAATVKDHDGSFIGLRANVWYAFLQASVRLLKGGGHLGFILPASCEYADYCRSGRAEITKLFQRVDLIRSNRPLFTDVQEGSAILVCRGKGGEPEGFRRHEVADAEEAIRQLGKLDERRARKCRPARSVDKGAASDVRLGDVMSVGLGGVTGDANYFLLTESQRKRHRLPPESVVPVLCRSKDIRRPSVSKHEWQRLRQKDAPVWLFHPSRVSLRHAAVKRYLRLSEKNGGCKRDRYKVRVRTPWYRTPLPLEPHGFISGMSPSGVWICFNEMRRLTATNTLYVVRFKEHLTRYQRYSWALSLLTSKVSRTLERATRIYADGLTKLEPGQLAEIRLPRPPNVRNAVALYHKALTCLLSGDRSGAQALADAVLFREHPPA